MHKTSFTFEYFLQKYHIKHYIEIIFDSVSGKYQSYLGHNNYLFYFKNRTLDPTMISTILFFNSFNTFTRFCLSE